jgi:hypothetical protein
MRLPPIACAIAARSGVVATTLNLDWAGNAVEKANAAPAAILIPGRSFI